MTSITIIISFFCHQCTYNPINFVNCFFFHSTNDNLSVCYSSDLEGNNRIVALH